MSIKEWWSQKVKGDRTESMLSGGGDPRVTGDPAYVDVNKANLKQAHETMLGHLANLGFTESNSFVTGDPYQAIYDMAKYEISLKGGKARLMPINLYERAQNLKEIAGTSSHERGGERIYAQELAEILEKAIKKWGEPGSTKVLKIEKVKEDLEQMSYEKSAQIHLDQINLSVSTRFNAAQKYIEDFYSEDNAKKEAEIKRLRGLNRKADSYSLSAIDELKLCGGKTGTEWRAYTGQKPVFK